MLEKILSGAICARTKAAKDETICELSGHYNTARRVEKYLFCRERGHTPTTSAKTEAARGSVFLEPGDQSGREHRADKAGEECIRSEEHTSELQSRQYLVCRLL